MAPWDERVATWPCVTQLTSLPGIASRRAADSDAPAAAAAASAAALPPPLCLAPAGPVEALHFDGSPAWAALVPAAAAALAARVPAVAGGAASAAASAALALALQRVPALYRGPRQLSCTYAFEWRCAGGTYRARAPRLLLAPAFCPRSRTLTHSRAALPGC
jgi:hypothetical protein